MMQWCEYVSTKMLKSISLRTQFVTHAEHERQMYHAHVELLVAVCRTELLKKFAIPYKQLLTTTSQLTQQMQHLYHRFLQPSYSYARTLDNAQLKNDAVARYTAVLEEAVSLQFTKDEDLRAWITSGGLERVMMFAENCDVLCPLLKCELSDIPLFYDSFESKCPCPLIF